VTSESAIFAVYVPTTTHPTTIYVFLLYFMQQVFHDPVNCNVHGIIDLEYFLQDLCDVFPPHDAYVLTKERSSKVITYNANVTDMTKSI
jgi:hypothetical protein